MKRKVKILFIDDSIDDVDLAVRELQRAGFIPEVLKVTSGDDFERALDSDRWDVILCERRVPLFEAADAWRMVRSRKQKTPFAIFTDLIYGEDLNALLDAGIYNFIDKNRMQTIAPMIDRLTAKPRHTARK